MPMVAWYMLSKESYMKRVMRDVLPTLEGVSVWSELLARRPLSDHTALLAEKDQSIGDSCVSLLARNQSSNFIELT